MLLDIKTHTLGSIRFHLPSILTVLEMRLIFPAVSLPVLHLVVVIIQLECTAGEK